MCISPLFLLIDTSISITKGRNAPGKPMKEVSEFDARCNSFLFAASFLYRLAFVAQHECC